MKGLQNIKRTNTKQDQNKIYFDANISLRPQWKSLFNFGILQQMFKMSAATQALTETPTPLCDNVVHNALVHALLLLSDALPQLIQGPDILSVHTFLTDV